MFLNHMACKTTISYLHLRVLQIFSMYVHSSLNRAVPCCAKFVFTGSYNYMWWAITEKYFSGPWFCNDITNTINHQITFRSPFTVSYIGISKLILYGKNWILIARYKIFVPVNAILSHFHISFVFARAETYKVLHIVLYAKGERAERAEFAREPLYNKFCTVYPLFK